MTDCNNYSDWSSWIGKRVCAKNNLFGTLRYFGKTDFSDGLWCGIELDNPLGKNDGTVNNVRYFTCNSNYGIFIPVIKTSKIYDSPGDYFEDIPNLNETFKIDHSSNKQEVESNSAILKCKNVREKLSNSGLGSTESLGILSLDLIDHDNSWDDFNLNRSVNDMFINQQNVGENSNSNLSDHPTGVFEKELYDTITNPKYASTPRVSKKKLVEYENDSDDSFNAKNHITDKFAFDIPCSSEVFFEVDKLKNNPNLTSTYKNLSDLAAILNNPELSPILLENKNTKQSANSENAKDVSKTEKLFQNSKEILCKTFEFHNSTYSPTSCGKEFEKTLNGKNELNVTTVIEDIKSINFDEKFNANATFEFQHPINTSLKLSLEDAKNLTFDLKESITKNSGKSDAYSKKELNTSSVLENFNGNTTFELNQVHVQQNVPDKEKGIKTFHSKEIKNPSLNEYVETNATDKNVLLLEKTFVFDLSIINESNESKIQNECFSNKTKFLKEICSFQNSSTQANYRNSICLPPSFCNELQKSVRRTSSASNYPPIKEISLKEMNGHKSSNKRGSISGLKVLHGKDNVFKKPFSPKSTLRNSKVISKSHSSVSSKENKNKANKDINKFPRNHFFSNTNNKDTKNIECKKNETAVKSQIKSSIKHKSEFTILKSCYAKNSSKSPCSLALPLKNKVNCDNPKQSNIVSKFYSKTIPVSKTAKNGFQSSTVTKNFHGEADTSNDVKTSKSQLKMSYLNSTFVSKSDSCNSLQNSNFPATIFSNKPGITKSSLVPCFKDKLPVGIIKPRYSMYQAKKDVISKNLEIEENECSQASKATEKNLQSNGEINSLKECSEGNSSKHCSNIRQISGLPKKIKSQLNSPNSQKPGMKQPIKKVGGIPTGLKIPRFSQNLKKF